MSGQLTVGRPGKPGRPTVRTLRAAIVLAAAGIVGVPSIARAQETRTWTRTPGSGERGTVITVSGRGCISGGGQPHEEASVYMFWYTNDESQTYDRFHRYVVNPDGSWRGTITVEAGAPPGRYGMSASCRASDMVYPYEHKFEFTVHGPAPTRTAVQSPRPTTSPSSSRPSPRPTRRPTATSSPSPRPTSAAFSTPAAPATTAPASTPAATRSSESASVPVPAPENRTARWPWALAAVATSAAVLGARHRAGQRRRQHLTANQS